MFFLFLGKFRYGWCTVQNLRWRLGIEVHRQAHVKQPCRPPGGQRCRPASLPCSRISEPFPGRGGACVRTGRAYRPRRRGPFPSLSVSRAGPAGQSVQVPVRHVAGPQTEEYSFNVSLHVHSKTLPVSVSTVQCSN